MYFVQTMLEGVLHDCCDVDHPSGRTLTPSFIPPHEFGSRCRSSGFSQQEHGTVFNHPV